MVTEQNKIFNKNAFKSLRQKLRHDISAPESILWSKLKGRQLNNLKFRRQYGVGQYVVDFYCLEHKLAIEIDGDSHYDESGFIKDAARNDFVGSLGIKLFRFTNKEVTENLEAVLEAIMNA